MPTTNRNLLTFVEILPFSNLSANALFLASSFNINIHITSCVTKALFKLAQQRKRRGKLCSIYSCVAASKALQSELSCPTCTIGAIAGGELMLDYLS